MRRHARVWLPIAALASFFAVVGSASATCPNEKVREEQGSTRLPECRAYEMVSPLKKGGQDVSGISVHPYTTSASNGDSVIFDSIASFGDSVSNAFPNFYKATRGPTGWLTRSVSPPSESTLHGGFAGHTSYTAGFTSDLSKAVVRTNSRLASEATPAEDSLYIRDLSTGAYQLLTPNLPADPFEGGLSFRDATPDYSAVAFDATGALTPDAPAGNAKAYAYTGSGVELVSYLPGPGGGIPTRGYIGYPQTNSAGKNQGGTRNAISDDGRYVYWSALTESPFSIERALYLRDRLAQTSSEVAPWSDRPTFLAASSDGNRALYTAGKEICVYDRIAVSSNCHTVTGTMRPLYATDDLSVVYFSAYIDNSGGSIYRWTSADDQVEPIVSMTGGSLDTGVFAYSYDMATHRGVAATPDGERLVFLTDAKATSYESGGYEEVYLYDHATAQITCLSCPAGKASVSAELGRRVVPTNSGTMQVELSQPRAISEDGSKVFFSTAQRLSPEDVNGKADVYLWNEGELRLVSTGTSQFDAYFLDASADGSDAFIVTVGRLNGFDTDELADVYDVRVEGGFTEPPARPVDCSGGGCEGSSFAAPSPTHASSRALAPGRSGSSCVAARRGFARAMRSLDRASTPKRRAAARKSLKRAQKRLTQCKHGGAR